MAVNLCIGCGICCDGTLFNRVVLKEGDEPVRLRAHGFTIQQQDDESFFTQSCRGFSDGCCTVYDDRPRTCRRFSCDLYRRHEAGEVGDDDALRAIRTTTELRDRVRTQLLDVLDDTSVTSVLQLQLMLAERVADGRVSTETHPQLMLDLGSLGFMLRRHFWSDETKKMAQDAAAAPGTGS
jgi:hypothetical protein